MKSTYSKLLCSALLVFVATACSAMQNVAGKASRNDKAGIVAGHGEPDLAENFGLEIALPVAENEFRSLLEENGIEFRLIDASDQSAVIPVPRYRRDFDPSSFGKMFEVYGGIDADRRVGKRFRAYVDANGMVVHLEDAFSYPAPKWY